MNDVFGKNYAEIMPKDELDHESGKVWFIPHHGIYHPCKKHLACGI